METGFRKWVIVVTIITSTIIELIDTTIVNVSINTMSGNLGASLEDTAWVITSYAIANVIVIPMTSFLAEKIGRKQYYIGSILLFTLASALCGFSTNLWELVAFRFLQGIGGGALLSTSQAILFETFAPKERSTAAGIFSLGIIIGPSVGPVLGGYIIDNLSWQWIFYVNIPIGLMAAFLSYAYLRPSKASTDKRSIDWLGIFLLTAGVGSLQVVLERGETDDWFSASYIVVLSILSVISLALLIWWELKIEFPVINLRVLKSTTLSISALMTFVLGFCLFSAIFVFPLYAQRIIGYTAFQTGMMMLPGTLMAALVSPFLGKILQSGVRPQYIIITGFLFSAIFGFMMSGSNLETGSAYFFIPLIFRGLGNALLIVPLTALAVSELKPHEIPQGAALNNMMRQMGGSFGIALINTYIAHRAAANRTALITHVTPGDPITQQRMQAIINNLVAHGSNYYKAMQQAIAALENTVVRQTYLLSYMNAFLLLAILNATCIPLVLVTIKKRKVIKAGKVEVSDAH
ncbi:MFS transporter, DHA2 family, multidrug resistance protein [Mucilaginibacter lappiensis]|uniref:DHA2 family multidrug resistance protein n=1 Tax=Mucilaginibacter lappiensis TaxID=354630 RepID=A0ABR6PD44_9SPHI|nr:DHA2 family efflux MFS transporter permease subunit [Mucilaginibacter lappiensis]MBB6107662.1 DHA2 family multidrug resistance protein [Mucilaginibacter lappiensis]SIQ01269.1 MFS transporter, DHA2 family, multidrug resistance protein [Mucilaginibacter lappiensis]